MKGQSLYFAAKKIVCPDHGETFYRVFLKLGKLHVEGVAPTETKALFALGLVMATSFPN